MNDEILAEDNDLIILDPKNAFAPGHLIIVPKQEFIILEDIPDNILEKLFQTANKISSILFDTLQCHGTNILIQNGVAAGQKNKVFSINIIPRFEKDDINFEWTPKQASQEDLEEVLNSLQGNQQKEQQQKYIDDKKSKLNEKKEEEIKAKDDEDNYYIKSLTRTG